MTTTSPLLLIGQYDSPFVRRVGLALRMYNMPFRHEPWSVFGDAEKVRAYNPLLRVPTLVLPSGDVVIDSHIIIDYLDSEAPAEERLFPIMQPQRMRELGTATLAMGAAEKAVAWFYEKRWHEQVSALWSERCRAQMLGALHELERQRGGITTPYWHGTTIGHADIAVAVAWRFIREAHPDVGAQLPHELPALSAFCTAMEALPVFAEIAQPFVPPA